MIDAVSKFVPVSTRARKRHVAVNQIQPTRWVVRKAPMASVCYLVGHETVPVPDYWTPIVINMKDESENFILKMNIHVCSRCGCLFDVLSEHATEEEVDKPEWYKGP